mmetsp:Transcript_93353/g.302090  ORF Transcript_93353/g.302090 Transcript_93353/m.302090 type:complete len:288 (+) Transcript_93353:6053-6916(+)
MLLSKIGCSTLGQRAVGNKRPKLSKHLVSSTCEVDVRVDGRLKFFAIRQQVGQREWANSWDVAFHLAVDSLSSRVDRIDDRFVAILVNEQLGLGGQDVSPTVELHIACAEGADLVVVGQEQRHLVQMLEQVELVQMPSALLVFVHVFLPEVFCSKCHHAHDVIPVRQRQHACSAQLELKDFRLALALDRGLRPIARDLRCLVSTSVKFLPSLVQELAELDAAQSRSFLTQCLLVFEHELVWEASEFQAVLHECLLQIVRQVLTCKSWLWPCSPAYFPRRATEDREDR